MTPLQSHTLFYKRMGLILIALLLMGFTPIVFNRFQSGGTLGPALIFHSFAYLLWFVLFVVQASLIAKKNIKLHQTLGKTSLAVVALLTISALIVTKNAYAAGSNAGTPFTPSHFIILPSMAMVMFIILYTLGFLNRREGETHKHYMLLASIVIMDPGLARLAMTLGVPPLALFMHFGLLGTVMVYDRKNKRKIHKATKIATAILVTNYISLFTFGPTETWAKIANMLYG